MTSRPARPHAKQTPEGRRVREVLSYSRRGSRLSEREQAAWERRGTTWVIPESAVDDPGFEVTSWFGRDAPLVVEVGAGVGESLAALARERPEQNLLAFEVWLPGVAGALWRLEEAGVDNVRLISLDAAWAFAHLFPADSVHEVWTFFPDPWPKRAHHKRRLVQPSFAADVARALEPGGWWRLATDWADYATQMREVLDAVPTIEGGPVPRWSERQETRFERRGAAAGRSITDLAYRRVGPAPAE